ncbi:hypothetical protein RIF29_19239 [Crotalaria pallida]|uniref:Uncharacterized protein n=1 Tax=Crotalaria pallida TaxID=3830 RepID=A0AAN9I7K0_CROPI
MRFHSKSNLYSLKSIQSPQIGEFLMSYGKQFLTVSYFKKLYLKKTGNKTIGTTANLIAATTAGAVAVFCCAFGCETKKRNGKENKREVRTGKVALAAATTPSSSPRLTAEPPRPRRHLVVVLAVASPHRCLLQPQKSDQKSFSFCFNNVLHFVLHFHILKAYC